MYKIKQVGLRIIRERTITVARESVSTAVDAAAVAHQAIGHYPTEHLIAIMLDAGNRITAVTTIAQGTHNRAMIAPRDVFRPVIAANAAGFILAHNHPSGDPAPSNADIAMTAALARASEIVGLSFLDHLIVTSNPNEFRSIGV